MSGRRPPNAACVVLREKTPERWRTELDLLVENPEARTRAACLIWWDYFAHRPARYPWPHLNDLLAAPYVEVSDAEIAQALEQCGYSPHMARNRARGGNGPKSL